MPLVRVDTEPGQDRPVAGLVNVRRRNDMLGMSEDVAFVLCFLLLGLVALILLLYCKE